MDELVLLSQLLKAHNALDSIIAGLIRRPVQLGHVGEYLAQEIFDVQLHTTAVHRGSDGVFRSGGTLAGRSVNVKWYPKNEGVLSVNPEVECDYYLVLTGPRGPAQSSRDTVRPLIIESVYLFDTPQLVAELRSADVKMYSATSIRQALWNEAEIYPRAQNPTLTLSDEQRGRLALFAGGTP
jgi:hypothetical protein